jgi:hypothetical protein
MKEAIKSGGILFYLALLLGFVFSGFRYHWFFIGLSMIALLSFLEDVKPQHWRLRMNLHTLAMLLMLYQWGLFQHYLIYGFFALIFCMWLVNAYTIMDEGHGMTVMYSLVTVLALQFINFDRIHFVQAGILEALLPALLVFGAFNFCKKPLFKPNQVGAVVVSYTIVFLISLLIIKSKAFYPLVLLAVYGFDTVYTLLHRLVSGQGVFRPHRLHLFQLLVERAKLPSLVVAGIYAGAQALITVGYLLSKHPYWYDLAVLVLGSAVYLLVRRWVFRKYAVEMH